RHIYSEYHLNADAKAAWHNRYAGPVGRIQYERMTKRMIANLREELAPRYDAEATETREAISAYMSGSRTKPARPDSPHRKISSMPDAEFKRELDKLEPGMAERTRI